MLTYPQGQRNGIPYNVVQITNGEIRIFPRLRQVRLVTNWWLARLLYHDYVHLLPENDRHTTLVNLEPLLRQAVDVWNERLRAWQIPQTIRVVDNEAAANMVLSANVLFGHNAQGFPVNALHVPGELDENGAVVPYNPETLELGVTYPISHDPLYNIGTPPGIYLQQQPELNDMTTFSGWLTYRANGHPSLLTPADEYAEFEVYSTIIHELGHALGLAHTDGTSEEYLRRWPGEVIPYEDPWLATIGHRASLGDRASDFPLMITAQDAVHLRLTEGRAISRADRTPSYMEMCALWQVHYDLPPRPPQPPLSAYSSPSLDRCALASAPQPQPTVAHLIAMAELVFDDPVVDPPSTAPQSPFILIPFNSTVAIMYLFNQFAQWFLKAKFGKSD
ncbi:hypothetical protein ACSERV_28245 [Pseudomonas aeruginosa]